jgi:Fe-S-cluster-containing dehydrogenase component/CRP-like cAMP-binding protein
MSSAPTAIQRPQRWDAPFDAEMSDDQAKRLLDQEPLRRLDPSRFPPGTPLLGLIKNDTRLIACKPGDLIVREGDYGSSAFFILHGSVRVALDDLPPTLLGRRDARKLGVWQTLAQLWNRASVPEARDPRSYSRAGTATRADGQRVFLQDVPAILDRHKTVRLETGEMFGEIAALSRTPRTATVFADADTRLLEIRWQGLRDLRRYAPELKEAIDQRYRERSLSVHLAETPLFQGLDAESLRRVAEATQFESFGSFDWYSGFRKGGSNPVALEPIAEQGHYPNGLILIRAGFARVSQREGIGERTLGYLGKGKVFGAEELLEGIGRGSVVPYRNSLRALGFVDVLRVPTAVVEQVLASRLSRTPRSPEAQLPEGMLDWLVERRFVNGTASMVIDLARCTRCDDCVRACSQTHGGNPRFLRHGPVHDRFMIANACMHCVDPVCMIGCPTGAIHRLSVGGQVVINDTTCIGCGTCAASCPYEAIRMVPIRTQDGEPLVDQASGLPIMKATKCDLCASQHGGPACQRACPHDALRRVDMQQLPALADWIDRR